MAECVWLRGGGGVEGVHAHNGGPAGDEEVGVGDAHCVCARGLAREYRHVAEGVCACWEVEDCDCEGVVGEDEEVGCGAEEAWVAGWEGEGGAAVWAVCEHAVFEGLGFCEDVVPVWVGGRGGEGVGVVEAGEGGAEGGGAGEGGPAAGDEAEGELLGG